MTWEAKGKEQERKVSKNTKRQIECQSLLEGWVDEAMREGSYIQCITNSDGVGQVGRLLGWRAL